MGSENNVFHAPHSGIAVFDVTGKTPPTILNGTDDGTWQRLALD